MPNPNGAPQNLKPQKAGEKGHNPHGRPKNPPEYASFKAFAKALSQDPRFLEQMQKDALSQDPKRSVKAREFILHYGIGKPKETIALEGGEEGSPPVKSEIIIKLVPANKEDL
jgi:hypothetical protein